VHIKDSLWSNLIVIVFNLTLAAGVLWGEHYSHGKVSILVWIFASVFVLVFWVPISAIRRPKSRLTPSNMMGSAYPSRRVMLHQSPIAELGKILCSPAGVRACYRFHI
jgi:hypothetical protein